MQWTQVAGSAPLLLAAGGRFTLTRNPTVNPSLLRLDALHRAAQAPRGLGARMVIVTDPIDNARVLDQYLHVWFHGPPTDIQLALQIDDGAFGGIGGTWENPGITSPALVRVAAARIPGTGLTHRLTVRAQAHIDGELIGPPGEFSFHAKTPSQKPNILPEWVSATLIRQTTDVLVDLSEIHWRHPGAVQIVARIPIRIGGGKWGSRIVTLAYADHHEDRLFLENIGGNLEYLGATLRKVEIGVAAIAQNQFGPITWAANPLYLRAWNKNAVLPPGNPDEIAGTAVHLIDSWFRHHARLNTLLVHPPETPQKNQIINTTYSRLFRKIKDIVRLGGRVALDDFGAFEARWNDARTVRGVAFVPSPGFREGTKAGLILRDDRAPASPEHLT